MNEQERVVRARGTLEQRRMQEALGQPYRPADVILKQPLDQELKQYQGRINAARAMNQHIEDNIVGRFHNLARIALQHLDPSDPFHSLYTALSRLHLMAPVGWAPKDKFGTEKTLGNMNFDKARGPILRLNMDEFNRRKAEGQNLHSLFMHAVGHEATHAATARAMLTNAALKSEMTTLLRHARDALGKTAKGEWSHYGLTDPFEFVAEAFSNERFQSALRNLQVPVRQSLWDHFKDLVRRVIGMPAGEKTSNVLDAVMSRQGELFQHPGDLNLSEGRREALQSMDLRDAHSQSIVGHTLDRLADGIRTEGELAHTVRNLGHDVLEKADVQGRLLSLMSPRQMSDFFSKHFRQADGSNPYKRYFDTFFRRNADNNAMMEKVGKTSNTWSRLEEKHGIDTAHKFSRLLHDATLYGVHPDVPLAAAANEHLEGDRAEARHEELAGIYKSLPEDYRLHYQELKKYYADSQREATAQILHNALHSMLTKGENAAMTVKDFDATYKPEDIHKLGLNTDEGLRREFGTDLSDAEIHVLTKIGTNIEGQKGPYFPLTRHGDYVTTAERDLGTKAFADSASANAYVASQRQDDPTLVVKLKKLDDGSYTVNTREREVRMAETKSEAGQNKTELAARYGEANVSPVQLRADLYREQASITAGSALDRILDALNGNPAAQNAVKDFYLQSLAEQSFRKRELSRSNVRGVQVENQHRAFAQYGRSASYYVSQLRYGRHLANALGDVQDVVRGHTDESQISAVRMGQLAKELVMRDKISRDPYIVGKIARAGTSFTRFAMMTSVSHWFVRASQPYMLSAPWLAARHGLGATMGAMQRAQALIMHPLASEAVDSVAGFKGMISSIAAEKTYSVMDQVNAHILARAGAEGKNYVAMLKNLRDNGIIDMSMATELRDIAGGNSTRITRVLNASQGMLHLVEVNNRCMTAIAAYDLAKGKGMDHDGATEFAKDAVAVTHNDYSYGNTPRAFMAQASGALGGMRPLLTQFMRYPQHVYAMLVQSTLQALHGASADEKATGFKTLAGVLGTHLAVAGLVGGLAVQPIKWAVGLAAAAASATGVTDQPFSVANALSGEAYERLVREATSELFGTDVGEIVAGGLPRAIGLDLSQRLALGQLYFVNMRTDSNASVIGSLMQSFGGAWLSQLTDTAQGMSDFAHGKFAQGIEQVSPHIIRDLVRATRFAQDGVVNNAGNTIIPAAQLTPEEIFLQAMGFTPSRFAEAYAKKATETDVQHQLQDEHKALTQAYVGAATPEDRGKVMDKVVAYNKAHPGFELRPSSLFKAVQSKAEADREIQTFGARIQARQRPEIGGYGSVYNANR